MTNSGEPKTTVGYGGGRGADGKFLPGNRAASGNPRNSKAQRLRGVLIERLTVTRMQAVADALIREAEAGDLQAIRELLNRVCGRPAETETLERIEAIETKLGIDR